MPRRRLALIAVFALALGGLIFVADRLARRELAATHAVDRRPRVASVEPADGAVGVAPVAGVKCGVTVPSGAGVDPLTLDRGVTLVRLRDNTPVEANRNTSGAGDDVVLVPKRPLELGTRYAFRVTGDLKDTAGVPFDEKTVTFTTADSFAVADFPAAFEKVPQPATGQTQDAFTTLAVGPDGLLYAGTFAGMIHRYAINADGTLTARPPVTTVLRRNGGPRLITGLTFGPRQLPGAGLVPDTVGNLVKAQAPDVRDLWVSHGQFAMKNGRPEGADDFTGKLSRLGGPDYADYSDVVVGLPRAYKDHLNFAPLFGPDGALYLSQGSNTSVGDVDVKWGYRPERKLTAAVLRLDLTKLWGGSRSVGATHDADDNAAPLDVKTPDGGGAYDPAAPDAPLTLYATGVRSGFRLLLHRNGRLYTGVNGAAGKEGNTPAGPGNRPPAIRDIKQTTDDLLLKLSPGAYYGHPNPARGQYVLNGGNPTAGVDPQEVPAYPVGTPPDPHYAKPAFVFGKNYSPNGLIDFRAVNGVAGALDGCVLVSRYSDGKDVIALKLNASGDVIETIAGLDGLTGLDAPLDLAQDPRTGNVYVAEYHGRRITLLRPVPGGVSHSAQITKVVP